MIKKKTLHLWYFEALYIYIKMLTEHLENVETKGHSKNES